MAQIPFAGGELRPGPSVGVLAIGFGGWPAAKWSVGMAVEAVSRGWQKVEKSSGRRALM